MSCKIKVQESKSGSYNNPKFAITLVQSGSGETQTANNYDVLAKLIGDNDLLINLDTSLLNLPPAKREAHALEFLKTVRSLGLEYRLSKVAPGSNKSFFAALLGARDTQEQAILTYVPNEIWSDSSFKKALPIFGLRYYILHEGTDASKLLEDMQRMLDDEKLDHFKLILFSSIQMNSIGVFTNSLTLSGIKNVLGM